MPRPFREKVRRLEPALLGADYEKTMSDVTVTTTIRPAAPRTSVQVRLDDGRIFEAPPGTTLEDVLRVAGDPADPAMVAMVDGRLTELSSTLQVDCGVTPITLHDGDGVRIYRRSIVFLLVTAASELFPDASILVDHAATTAGAYFCSTEGRAPFTQEELDALARRMRDIVDANEPIRRLDVPLADAVATFTRRGEEDKVRLLAHRTRGRLNLYELRGRRDYLQGYMVPSTGSLRYFALHAFPPGFMLQFPHASAPTELGPIPPYPKLFAVFEEYGRWLERLGVRGVGVLNDAIEDGRLPEISLVAEALHEGRIARIAADVIREQPRIKLVLIAGPSSSGKTTFGKRLAVQLLANGVRPFPVALDDYFLERDRTPRDEHGDYDYESLGALDVTLFNEHLRHLMVGETVDLPRYNFKTGRREAGDTVRLGDEDVVLVEGIHGLNPALIEALDKERVYRIYVSALTQLNLDRHNRVSTTDCRLIRRIVRDAATRGYDAQATLQRWPSVVAGEKKHIFPFQEHSEAVFNSALAHEIAVLRPFAEPLLLQVRPETPQYREAKRLLSFLQWFRHAPADPVPTNSILREFIGGSVLETFRFVRKNGAAGRFSA
jgi:uridine kinase